MLNNGLENFCHFDIHLWSNSVHVQRVVDHIYREIKYLEGNFSKKEAVKKRHIHTIILNLYTNWTVSPEMYTAYHRRKGSYRPADRYNSLHISFTTVQIVDGLETLGYLESRMGFYDRRVNGHSRASRMRATPKLIHLMHSEYAVQPTMISTAPNRESIILRKPNHEGKKLDIEYTDTELTNQMRRDLNKYNSLIQKIHLDINCYKDILAERGSKIDLTKRFVRRIFSNGRWDHGGRFYGGWWQNLESEYRKEIIINYEPSIELDYSGLHIAILYTLEGIDFEAEGYPDPYSLPDIRPSSALRRLLKTVLLTALNADNLRATVQAVQNEIQMRKELISLRKERINIA